MKKQAIYAVAFLNSRMELKIHKGIHDDVDVENKEAADDIKSKILADYFLFDEDQNARNMDGFDDFTIMKIESHIRPDVVVKVEEGRISGITSNEEVRIVEVNGSNEVVSEHICSCVNN